MNTIITHGWLVGANRPMPDPIDEDGRLFGFINIVDLFVIAAVLVMVVAGGGLLFNSGNETPDTSNQGPTKTDTNTVVTFHATNVKPYVAGTVMNGSLQGPGVIAVRNKTANPATIVTTDRNGEVHLRDHPTERNIRFTATLRTHRINNTIKFRGKNIKVNNKFTFSTRTVDISATITAIHETRNATESVTASPEK